MNDEYFRKKKSYKTVDTNKYGGKIKKPKKLSLWTKIKVMILGN